MKSAISYLLLAISYLLFATSVQAATHESIASGYWSADAATVWDSGTDPVNGDVVNINSPHTVTFDKDMSGWANGVTVTIDDGATLIWKDDAGSYYLLTSADITLNGILQFGTSTSVPFTGTATISFNNTAHSIERSATGHIYMYCAQPTNKYITLTEGEPQNETTIVVGTDVTSDWTNGNTVCIIDSDVLDVEYVTAATINASNIVISGGGGVGGGLDSAVGANSIMTLVTRNIKIINVAASDYAITYAAGAGDGDYIGVELSSCYRGISGGTGWEFAGTTNLLTTSPRAIADSTNATISGVICGTDGGSSAGLYATASCNITGLFAGITSGCTQGQSNSLSGRIFGGSSGVLTEQNFLVTSTGVVDYCGNAFSNTSAFFYGEVSNNNRGFLQADNLIAAGTFSNNSSGDLDAVINGKSYNSSFASVTEFANYNSSKRSKNSYFESFDHDGVENAYKAWCRGGIVTSQTASPPTGYDIWYEHACESATYPCFRQYQTTVLPGTAIEVSGKIRIADAEDLSSNPPELCIIDYFADPLVDDTQTCLDECPIPVSDGSVTDWQDVDVIWANTGDAPRTVYVRMIAYHATANIDSCWSIASYQDQIAALYNSLIPIRTDVATADTTTSFTLTAGKAATNSYRYNTIAIQDADDGLWEQRKILEWTTTRDVVVDNAFTFTPDVGDLAYILSAGYGEVDSIISGTVPDNTSTENSIKLGANASGTNDIYNENLVTLTGGTGKGQNRLIADYVGAIKTAVLRDKWLIIPDDTTTYRIKPFSGILLSNTGLVADATADTITLNASAQTEPNIYRDQTIYISGGVGYGQARLIKEYSADRVATIEPAWDIIPEAAASIYITLPLGVGNIYRIVDDIIEDTGTTIPAQITALNDISIDDVNTAMTNRINLYDPPTKTEMDAGFAALNDVTAAEVWDAICEGTYSYKDYFRLMASKLFWTVSGGGTTTHYYKDSAGTKTRITETIDSNANRTNIVVDPND